MLEKRRKPYGENGRGECSDGCLLGSQKVNRWEWISPHTRPVTRDEAHNHFKRPLAASRWDKIKGWHCFRHSFCSNCAMKGIDQRIIDEAMEEDEASARAEYLAEFRRDVETFVSLEAVQALVIPDQDELQPIEGVLYRAFVDPSGGSSDSMTQGPETRASTGPPTSTPGARSKRGVIQLGS